ncbi:MAG: hypothetical protein ACR2RF_26345 [Geminicoccaceae bacterium]
MVEFAPTTIPAGKAHVKMAQHGTDEDINVEFYRNPVDGKDHIKFLIPGDKTFQPDYLVDDMYKQRFPRQWEAYEAQRDQFAGQMRLEDIAWMDDATRNLFKAHNVYTVEMLAGVSDGNLAKLGPEGRIMRDKAREEVDQRSKAAAYEASEAEKAALRGELDQMKAQIAELTKKPAKRGPGRPPKEQSDAA